MKSFSSIVKEEISQFNNKQKLCCSFSLLYGMMCFSNSVNSDYITISTNAENQKVFQEVCKNICTKKRIEYSVNGRKMSVTADVIKCFTIAEIEKSVFKCQHCRENFLKGIFLMYGTVTDPQRMYRLDLCFNENEHATQVFDMLSSLGLGFKKTIRKNKHVLYTKDSDCISDLLALVGANNSVYEVINSKIEKELRNEVNRVTNCDAANINKTIQAAQKYCVIIKKIIDEGLFDELPDNLKEMAKKRIEFENINFTDLGKKFNPTISKSGVYHRLEKILSFYENAKNIGK